MTSLTRQHLLPSSTLVPALLFFVASFFPAHIEAGNLARLFSSSACKTVNTSDPFDLKNYTAHPWYVQQQQVRSLVLSQPWQPHLHLTLSPLLSPPFTTVTTSPRLSSPVAT
jgi:hypothetical protein